MSLKTVVVISDTQIPYEDRRAVRNVIQFIGEYQPDEVVQIGDLMDYPTPSRWSKGTRDEYAQTVIEHSEYAQKTFLAPLRDVYDGPIGILEGNHDERPRVYLEREAPALAEFRHVVSFETLCNFTEYRIDRIPAFTPAGPDTVFVHGHEIKGMSQIAGTSAYNHASKAGANIIMGHTHRLGIRRHTAGYIGGRPTLRWGFEVGNLMDAGKAQYLGAGGVANWQQGFGLLYVGQYDVSPVAVDVRRDGSFVVEGQRYGTLRRASDGKFAPKSA